MLELTTNLLVDLGGWPALKEARALLDRGKVSQVSREGAVIRARVQGPEKAHEPSITLADRAANVQVRCTCVDFRRSGRVCAHALAAGLAVLHPEKVAATSPPPASTPSPSVSIRLPRVLRDDTPPGTPGIELTVLLPLNLHEALGKDPVRVILEARREGSETTQPWDAVLAAIKGSIAVSEEDDRVLTALERVTGSVAGINTIPREKMGNILRALGNHPRVWSGKKERLKITATTERPRLLLSSVTDGALVISAEVAAAVPSGGPTGNSKLQAPPSGRSPLGTAAATIPSWTLQGTHLQEIPELPSGFTDGRRVIAARDIPAFLSSELPTLERAYDLDYAPGFEEFRLETEMPVIAVRLEGALSGLTLELVASYPGQDIPLAPGTSASTAFSPDPRQPRRYWRRDPAAERAALAQVDAAGFVAVRGGAAKFSLTGENAVTRFLANTLPRWRQMWSLSYGSRLEETLRTVDIAEPEFSFRPTGSGEDWLSLDLKLTVRGQPVPLDAAEIQRWLQTGQTHARTADKRVLLVPTEAWGEMREVLADANVQQQPGRIQVARTYAPFVSGALTAQGFHGAGLAEPEPAQDFSAALPASLRETLRSYQLAGFSWFASLAQRNLNGLLADDMGLGKTLQALAFAAWLRKANRAGGPVLIVCPTSLVTNWLREAARFTPHLKTLDLTGVGRADKWADRAGHDLLVTSYAILRRDIELYRAENFSLVILDEAQHIKNRGSQNAQAAKALRSARRAILTGTPLENSILDLWSLYDFLLPGYLGTAADFRERYETPLTRGPEPRTMERLRHKVRPFFLRRTKEEVLKELPPKLDYPALCELTDEQKEVYRAVLEQGRRDVFEHSDKAGRKAGRDRLAVLTTLLRLRQVCCHLDLLPAGDQKRQWQAPSAKLDRTFELIDEAIDGGHRILLFSQFVRMLHLIRDEAKRRELPFCYLDGQTVERQAEIDRFQADADIPLFLISLKAGGTGLNLTGADTVIHFDPWWNPAVEEQATARAHRLGQTRRVAAYKLIAAGTVEEKIQAMQSRKRELFEASVGSDEAFVEKLTGDDLEELLAS